MPLEASGGSAASSEFCYGPRFSGKLAPLEALGIYHRVNVLQYNTDADSIGAVVCANAQKLQVRPNQPPSFAAPPLRGGFSSAPRALGPWRSLRAVLAPASSTNEPHLNDALSFFALAAPEGCAGRPCESQQGEIGGARPRFDDPVLHPQLLAAGAGREVLSAEGGGGRRGAARARWRTFF